MKSNAVFFFLVTYLLCVSRKSSQQLRLQLCLRSDATAQQEMVSMMREGWTDPVRN